MFYVRRPVIVTVLCFDGCLSVGFALVCRVFRTRCEVVKSVALLVRFLVFFLVASLRGEVEKALGTEGAAVPFLSVGALGCVIEAGAIFHTAAADVIAAGGRLTGGALFTAGSTETGVRANDMSPQTGLRDKRAVTDLTVVRGPWAAVLANAVLHPRAAHRHALFSQPTASFQVGLASSSSIY